MHVWDFLLEFCNALHDQLEADETRWGSTWLERTRKGQEVRTDVTFSKYFEEYYMNGTPVPWLKVAGNAMICWIRENHPELWKE